MLKRMLAFTFIFFICILCNAEENTLLNLEGTFTDSYTEYPIGNGEYKLTPSGGSLKLSKADNGSIKFELYTVQPNTHSCGITGLAKLDKESIIFQDKIGSKECRLVIYISGKFIRFSDSMFGECRSMYCGAQGSIEQTLIKLP